MRRCKWLCLVIVLAMILSAFVGCSKESSPAKPNNPPSVEVNGTLTEYQNISVIRMWGTDREKGFAHGYLLADYIVNMLDNMIGGGVLGMNAETWENSVIPAIGLFTIEQRFQEELQGMLAGIQEKLGDSVEVASLGRPLKCEDLTAIQIGPDFMNVQCSSFSGWGPMTVDSCTITGRNFDWKEIPGVFEKQLVMVYVEEPGSGRLGFVTIGWPGSLGCFTAMNAEGVTLNINNTNGFPPEATSGFHPRILTYREVVESSHAQTATEDAAAVLRSQKTATPQNLMITMPYTGSNQASVVFEYDGRYSLDDGATIREPYSGQDYQICTNHCRKRKPPINCSRYSLLNAQLDLIAASEGANHLTLDKAWELLEAVALDNPTHHRVIFEPNKKLMHVALSVVEPAPQRDTVTFSVEELLRGVFEGSD